VLIIAFDTATPAVTVALHDGRDVVARETAVDARRHGELLAPAIAAVLASAGADQGDLTAVAVGVGPGPYTGLRAGLVTAQVFGSTLGVAVHGVCTLDIIAARARQAAAGRELIVATDARRREVYWARYAAGGERISGPLVSLPGELAAELLAGTPVAGQGPRLYSELAASFEVIEPAYPDAADLASIAADRIARGLPAGPAEPLYLRRPDAREPGRPKRVTPAPPLTGSVRGVVR
jgi:tRNA threonylcarbamoyl adenosine modification protein YeaZ